MKHRFPFRRVLAAVLMLALAASLTGCGGRNGGAKALRLDLSGKVASLDPQLSTTALERCLLQNCMEGLLRQLPDGTITEGVAKDYSITADGLTYSFYLREDAAWSDGTPLTADDFLFAFQRILRGEAGAEAAQQFSAIQNGWSIYQGLAQESSLGVTAADSHTLIIRLSEKDPMLLEKLCQSVAFPCNREYFESTHSRYGNMLDYMIFNGPFTMSSWSGDSVKLLANEHYSGVCPAQSPSATLYLNRSNALDAFLNGETDFYSVDFATSQKLPTATTTLITFQNGMVELLLNEGEDRLTANPDLRRALCLSVEMLDYVENGRLPAHYEYTTSLAPSAAKVYSESYYDLLNKGFLLGEVTYTAKNAAGETVEETVSDFRHSNQLGFSYSLSRAKAALRDSELTEVTGLTILIEEDSDLLDFAGWLQKQWYDHLRIIVNLETVDSDTFRQRLSAGDYTLAIASYTAGTNLDSVYRGFLTGSAPVTFRSDRLTQLLELAIAAPNVSEAVRYYANAEALLLDEAIAMPLFTASSYFAMGEGVAGIEVSSDGGFLFLARATRS